MLVRCAFQADPARIAGWTSRPLGLFSPNSALNAKQDLLAQMRRNPAGDWSIGDVEVLCRQHGLTFIRGAGTSHCHVKHRAAPEMLTIPARRPIKPVYIRLLVRYILQHGDAR
ncbi:hypothetical protein ABEG18_19530 [Alsobacter sp. KACC 23698]|uniref:Type II toxin-antitoxin system HicA family toxin n=1 Tax=Alsobacter sp. KACC 23698 TaxID=3149229 RepID=A0AAU7JBZ3_9HYPH